jgi:GNAT superfamily N-acetyltransferase
MTGAGVVSAVFDLTELSERGSFLPGLQFRVADTDELDLLCEIDLDASRLFEHAGLFMMPPNDQELAEAERRRWMECLRARCVLLAVNGTGESLGFMALAALDDEPYLEQLSVRMHAMRRGIGSALLNAALRTAENARARSLWLNTYGHLSWNRPFYERAGFRIVPVEQWGGDMAREILFQRRVLPAPDQRVVMRKSLGGKGER